VNATFTEGTEMMMRNAIVLLGTLTLAACSRDQHAEKPGSTTTTGASADAGVTVEEVRIALLEHRPNSPDVNAVVITNDNGVITLRGKVDDDATRADMLNTVRSMPNVKGVRDELQVSSKGGQMGQGGQGGQGQMGQGGQGGQGQMGQGGQGQMGQGGQMNQPSDQGGQIGQAQPGDMGQQKGSTHTKNADAVRAKMAKDRPQAAAIVNHLIISDDGTVVLLSGTVPDEPTHDALVKSAKSTPGVKSVKDDLHVSGK
jgi:osmotically-inducible protein OsmY